MLMHMYIEYMEHMMNIEHMESIVYMMLEQMHMPIQLKRAEH